MSEQEDAIQGVPVGEGCGGVVPVVLPHNRDKGLGHGSIRPARLRRI